MKKDCVRQSVFASGLLMLALFGLPTVTITPYREQVLFAATEETDTVQEAPAVENLLPAGSAEAVIRVLHEGRIEEMQLSDYLFGVVRAEMPASFEPDALKAQAVAARTYTLYKLSTGGSHGAEADICTQAACCQAYTDKETAWARWGEAAAAYEGKVRRAVEETAGQVLLYGEEPILAVFHAASAGMTRSAGAVWSSDLPYLQAVASPEPKDSIPEYYSQQSFSIETFRQLVQEACPNIRLGGEPQQWLSGAVTDGAGNVEQITVGDAIMKGSRLRSILGLRSACFSWEITGETVTFYVTGYGHGVGLSQHGANQMAKEGRSWQEILLHYYTGVRIGGYYFTNMPQT